ncbi:unnamed protein product [Chironomus riparius]|uniref:IMD domain-containing protein n=1 Tax=Chironomus riparius TaxID=315576 RepID=A0A9P0IV34_9DIPT|nr:unnamed protein product [Chironomus riparius]
MDISIEKVADITLGSLFQQIINDMKNSSPLWEDFIIKATKLHACLRAAIQAISTYLEAFQKIADAATNSKGASKEIGTALTRVCLRHKAVETRLKTFTTAIMDSLIIPLQDKLEEWKRQVVILDKDHTKEYKRCRNELKKRSSDTLRLQKKAKKGTTDLQSLVDSSMQTVNQQKAELDEVERKSLRIAMIEDRTRYCQFVHMLEPVVKQEYEMMYELGHLQEAMMTVTNVTKDPSALPQASEELIAESKTSYNLYPESPTHSSSQGCSNSLGSRKSSVCSISSMNSSGSSGSPSHQFQRSLSQYNPTIRLKPGESTDSRDSGFCSSSPALTIQASTATSQSHAISTWPPPTQESVSNTDRPHTISTAYERGHQRPALTVYTFQNPDQNISENSGNSTSQKSPANISCRPPLPIRCSSLERPLSTTTNTKNTSTNNVNARQCPSPIPAHVAKEHPAISQPTYVNMSELASMAAYKNTNTISNNIITSNPTTSTTPPVSVQPNSPVLSSASSLVSPDSSATNPISSPDVQTPQNTPQTNSPLTIAIAGGNSTTDTVTNNDDEDLSSKEHYSTSTTPTNQNAPVNNNNNTTTTSSSTLDNNISIIETITTTLSTMSIIGTTSAAVAELTKCESPLIDTKSSGSVLDKASMFEKKLEEQQTQINATPTQQQSSHHPISLINSTLNLTPATVARLESIYGKKTEEIYNKTAVLLEKVDTVETLDVIDTIELDNLIGELDMFQREHEEKEKKRLERQQSNEYQVPKNSIVQTQKTHHNDSFISTSTTITGTFSHAFSNNNNSDECSEKSTDKVSLNASLNYSITSNTSMMTNATLSDVQKTFNSSENCWNDNNNDDDLSADTGFENPSFRHLNDTNIVLMRDDDLPPNYYSQNATDVVVLRSKSNSMGSNNNSITDLHTIDMTNEQKQRLSSFKLDNNNLSLASSNGQGSPSHYFSINNSNSINNNNPIPNVNKASLHKSFGALMYGQTEEPITSNNVNVNNNVNVVTSSNKPAVTPRPASLLSGVSRIARRSSVNTVKPPPPVRRSSSATPNHYSDANNSHNNQLQNQQQFNSSSEALPPPPDYLLRSQQQAAAQQQQNALHHHQNAQQQQQQQQHHYSHHAEHNANAKTHYMTSSTSVGQISSQLSTQNVRTVNDLRNAPNSPGVMRRQLSLSNHHPSSNHSQSSHSITYSSQPSTPKIEKEGSGSMFSIYGLTTGSGNANGTTYSSGDIFGTMPRQTKSQQGVYAQPKQVSGISSFRNSSPNPPPQKQSMGLLASLTAKIAPNKSHNQQQQQQQQQNQQQQQQQQQSDYDRSRNEPIYQRRSSNQSNQYYDTAQQQQQQQQPNYGDRQSDDYQTGNYGDKTDSVLAKANPNFLDNLNAKLAEQHATNKALAVRSFINSKVVRNGSQIPCNIKYVANRIVEEPEPDPRIVRESLMDQIKRGANLKQTPR